MYPLLQHRRIEMNRQEQGIRSLGYRPAVAKTTAWMFIVLAVGMTALAYGVGVRIGEGQATTVDASDRCRAEEVYWFSDDESGARECLNVDTVLQEGVSAKCQEDEVFAWVANDTRGCVNYDTLYHLMTD